MSDRELNDTRRKLHIQTGELNYYLEVFGDRIAEREGYKKHSGIDAVHFYLVSKYHWLPSVVRSMSYDDMHFLLSEEMSGSTVPKDAR
jgi:hypothetical protein